MEPADERHSTVIGGLPSSPMGPGSRLGPDPATFADLDKEPLVTLVDIRAAAETLRGVVLRTPLVPFGPPLPGDPRGRPRTWLKAENLQPIGAFKLRGAYNALAQLPVEQRARGVVTASSGNHAQGVSRAARLFGIRAVVVMPSDAPAIKRERVAQDGAEIVTVGTSSSERIARAEAIALRDGLALIPSFDNRHVIAGQGTAGLEIAEQVIALQDGPHGPIPSGPFTVLVPVGGGGLASGVATAVKSLRPDAVVMGVEPSMAADGKQSLDEGRIVSWTAEQVARTSADGMRTTALGKLPFRHLQRYLDDIILVEEVEIAAAMARAMHEARLVVEPSGATSLAAWLFHADQLPANGPVVCLISGGNVDPETLARLVAPAASPGS